MNNSYIMALDVIKSPATIVYTHSVCLYSSYYLGYCVD